MFYQGERFLLFPFPNIIRCVHNDNMQRRQAFQDVQRTGLHRGVVPAAGVLQIDHMSAHIDGLHAGSQHTAFAHHARNNEPSGPFRRRVQFRDTQTGIHRFCIERKIPKVPLQFTRDLIHPWICINVPVLDIVILLRAGRIGITEKPGKADRRRVCFRFCYAKQHLDILNGARC